MPNKTAKSGEKKGMPAESYSGEGGELHLTAGGTHPPMSSQNGVVIGDDENTLKGGDRGPSLIEDHFFVEKTQHFDHERIPERIVHARGVGAKGYFELTRAIPELSKAAIFNQVGQKTPVFVRFSTVAGNMGSTDLARDVRGFAVKFYTSEGNWDLVGNNIPVFFIQDAIKFTDLIHSVKQEPDRGFPQAASAHDTFWDFASLMPESTHMLFWVMSDRAIPRSLRLMDGFGVHTFRFLNSKGDSHYVKFHWRPTLGTHSVIWDEAVKISGADPDFHRRDLWNNIEEGNFPEWQLGVQVFDDAFADSFDFDILDATKLIPEELVPIQFIGRMVLDQNVSNQFAETEQVAFCTRNIVPGIDFTNDPLLQGRNLSYIDTQLSRLGGPNYTQLPVNAPRCPVLNMQRDGHGQHMIPTGRVSYSPSSLDPKSPRQDPHNGASSFPAALSGDKRRTRAASFADHFSQARQFFYSLTEPEQNHIIAAFTFELSKVETKAVRERMVGQLANVDAQIAQRVATGLGMMGPAETIPPAVPARLDLRPSPALSMLRGRKPSLKTFVIGCLVAEGTSIEEVNQLIKQAKALGASVKIVALKVGGIDADNGKLIAADAQLAGAPSVLFDCIYVALNTTAARHLARSFPVVNWLRDAYSHLKVIGYSSSAESLLPIAQIAPDEGVVPDSVSAFLDKASGGRVYEREMKMATD